MKKRNKSTGLLSSNLRFLITVRTDQYRAQILNTTGLNDSRNDAYT